MKSIPVKLTYISVLFLILSSGSTATYLACQPTLTEQQDRVFQGALVGCTIGTTSMIGLFNHRSDR